MNSDQDEFEVESMSSIVGDDFRQARAAIYLLKGYSSSPRNLKLC